MSQSASTLHSSRREVTRRRLTSRQQAEIGLAVAGFVCLHLVWWLAGDNTRFVPSITEVFSTFPEFLSDGEVWQESLLTLSRVLISLAIAFVLAGLAALAMFHAQFWGRVVAAYVAIATAVPSTILALLGLFLFRRSDKGVLFVVVVTTLPFITVLLYEGLKTTSRSLAEMSTVYRIKGAESVRHVLLPQVAPYAFTALRNEHAHAWKVVVLAELFIINSGMGWQFSQAFDKFQLVLVMHWMLLFVGILLATEYLVIRPLEARMLRWKEKS